MSKAPKYFPLRDFGGSSTEKERVVTYSPVWAIAVIRLGTPLSFDRQKMASKESDITSGAFLRADKPMVIVADVESMTVSNSKGSHVKMLSAKLKNSKVNYLVEILPGDWVFAWMLYGEDKLDELVKRINKLEPCNQWEDGLKFVGRVADIFKEVSVTANGMKKTEYTLSAHGFDELNSQLYYDMNLASRDVSDKAVGSWLARIGKDVEEWFANISRTGVKENNVNVLIPQIIDLLIGNGVAKTTGINIATGIGNETVSAAAGGGADREAPYAYIIPTMVGKLLGREPAGTGSKKSVLAYSAILELLQGVQEYSSSDDDGGSYWFDFIPSLSSESKINRRICEKKLLGSFLPYFPELANKPLWNILTGYLNPEVNELYTCLRVNPDGVVMPTVVLRQIPFTTNEFDPNSEYVKNRLQKTKDNRDIVGGKEAEGPQLEPSTSTGTADSPIPFTRFLDLPRWVFVGPEVNRAKLGRSNIMRTNFVHVYGANLVTRSNVTVTQQIVNSPPIKDDVDIQRSGVHAHIGQINCAVQDEIGGTPGIWMALVADRLMGAQYTLSGGMTTKLIRAPIVEGDNVEFDGVVYHIESVTHSVSVSERGIKTGMTSLSLSNGMRSDSASKHSDEHDSTIIYAGFKHGDSEGYDPGIAPEGATTTGDSSDESGMTEAERDRQQQGKLEDSEAASQKAQDVVDKEYTGNIG